ncbi:MAG: hypothetical protein JW765_01350 [Deltaproteobacteria bacterium]|nr:hypothetical protein [Candidatus Zymogenaceae bacterium]
MGDKSQKADLFAIELAAALIALSAILYFLHYMLFRDPHHIFIYLVGDIAFLPIEVLIVTIIIDRLLKRREKDMMMTKMNMVIGIFFSEVGTKLLRDIASADGNVRKMAQDFLLNADWSAKGVAAKKRALSLYTPDLDTAAFDLTDMKDSLVDHRDFLLRLLENPNLLEHERFTDLLWAVFHLMDELSRRTRFQDLPNSDVTHLAGDMRRAYAAALVQWIDYMKHLHDQYPYLFSLAMRSNPFDPNASIIVTS